MFHLPSRDLPEAPANPHGRPGRGVLESRNVGEVLEWLTSHPSRTIISRLKATLLVRNRITYGEELFAEIVVWRVPRAIGGSAHSYKYRLALVAYGKCVLRYDNETGKGDHRHARGSETRYRFSTLDKLFADFERDVREIMNEDRNS